MTGPLLDQALGVFGYALGFPLAHSRVQAMRSIIQRHAARAGFRAFGAFDAAAELVGFSHGYTSQPGLWWREQVVSALSVEHAEYWFADAFELAELHVHPCAQGRKLGSQLHDGLLYGLAQRTALLSVMHRSQRARQLYSRRGWQTLIADLRFSTEPATPFSVLGLEL